MDRKNLEAMQNSQSLTPRQVRWSQFFSRFDFYITYVLGSCNLLPDVLSWKLEYVAEQQPPPRTAILQPRNFKDLGRGGMEEKLGASRQAEDLIARIKTQQVQDPFASARMDDLQGTWQGADSPFSMEGRQLRHRQAKASHAAQRASG
ncbi:uncharacterized protein PHA67_015070 [Liasis olivaceus]